MGHCETDGIGRCCAHDHAPVQAPREAGPTPGERPNCKLEWYEEPCGICPKCEAQAPLLAWIKELAAFLHAKDMREKFHDPHTFGWETCNSVLCVKARAAIAAARQEGEAR